MNKQELANLLNSKVTSYREYRMKYAQLVIKQKELFKHILEIAFDEEDKVAIRASWVLDYVVRENIAWIYPHLDYFTNRISTCKHHSIVRPMAKICEILALKYTSKNSSEIKKHLIKSHIEKIIETGFDWMITDQKVAVKAYTMQTLFEFGKENDWVHDELQLILEQTIVDGSAGYKSRGKKILKSIQNYS